MSTFDAGSIEAKLTLDRSQFKRELKAARADAEELEKNGIQVNAEVELDDEQAKARIREIEAEFKRLQDPKVRVDMDDEAAKAKIKELIAELKSIRDAHANVDVDTAGATAKIAKVKEEIRSIPNEKNVKVDVKEGNGVGRTQLLITAILAALPLIPPLVAVAGVGIVALAAALSAAAVGAGILGLGIYGVIQQYDSLVKKKKELTAVAKEYQAALKGMTSAWNGFISAIAPAAISLLTQFFRFVEALLPKLVPIFNQFADVASFALKKLSDWMMGPQGAAVLKWIETFGGTSFGEILGILGNVAQTLVNILMAFTGPANDMLGWLYNMTSQWVVWSRTLSSNPQFQAFIQYARDNAPAVGAALVAIAKAITAIAVAVAPLGPPLLTMITNLGNFIAGMNPDDLQKIVLAVGGLAAAWTLLEAALSLAAAAVTVWGVATAIATPITWAFATAFGAVDVAALPLIGAIAIIIALIVGLGIAFYEAYQHIGPFHDAVNAVWKLMGDFGRWLGGWISSFLGMIGGFFGSMIKAILGFGQNIRNTGRQAWTALKADTVAIVSATVSAVVNFFQGLYQRIVGFGQGIRNTGRQAFAALKSDVSGIVSAMVSTVSGFFSNLYGIVSSKAASIQSTISSKFNAAKAAAASAFNGLVSAVSGALGRALSAVSGIAGRIQGVFAGAGGWLISAGANIIGGLVQGIRNSIGEVQSILSSVTNLIPDWKGPAERDARLLRPAGNLIMQGLVAGIGDQFGPLRDKLSSVTDLIGQTSGSASARVTGQGTMGGGGSAGPTVNINVYNPVAEPSSLSAVNGIKDLAVLGVFA